MNTGHFTLLRVKYNNYDDTVKLLLQHGANPTMRNDDSATPAMVPVTPDLYKEFTKVPDSNGNMHVHLLAMTTAHDIADTKLINNLFVEFLNNYMTHYPAGIWATNNDGKLAIEVAYETYRKHRLEYDMNKARYLYNVLIAQEKQLHTFAQFYASHMEHKPITISSPCADQLNVETAIAEQCKSDEVYYKNYHESYSIPYRDKLKQDLYNAPHTIPKLYVSQEGYIPPKILSIQEK